MAIDPQTKPGYGAIDHYLEVKGEDYFAWQSESGIIGAQYNLRFWEPYIAPSDDVLDFGCGGGFLLKVLNAQRKIGVEINPAARATAAKMGIEVYPSVDLVPGKFDKVISSHALEHVPHPRQAILELKEKLKDSQSRLILLLPLDDWRSREQATFDPNDMHMHLYTWTPKLIGNLLMSCDLDVLDVRVVQHAWPPKSSLLWKISPSLFHAAAYCWSGIINQRQLFAAAALKK